jgi:hypothetical protein
MKIPVLMILVGASLVALAAISDAYLEGTVAQARARFAGHAAALVHDFPVAVNENGLPALAAGTMGLLASPSGQGPLLAASALISGRSMEEHRPAQRIEAFAAALRLEQSHGGESVQAAPVGCLAMGIGLIGLGLFGAMLSWSPQWPYGTRQAQVSPAERQARLAERQAERAPPSTDEAAGRALGEALRRAQVSPEVAAEVMATFWAADPPTRRTFAHAVAGYVGGGLFGQVEGLLAVVRSLREKGLPRSGEG